MLSLLPLSLQSLYLLQSRVASTQLIRTVQHARTAFCRSRREYMQSGEELTEEFCTLLRNSPLRQHFVQFSHPFTHFTTFPFFFCFSRGCVIHLGRERDRERETRSLLSPCEKNGTFAIRKAAEHTARSSRKRLAVVTLRRIYPCSLGQM